MLRIIHQISLSACARHRGSASTFCSLNVQATDLIALRPSTIVAFYFRQLRAEQHHDTRRCHDVFLLLCRDEQMESVDLAHLMRSLARHDNQQTSNSTRQSLFRVCERREEAGTAPRPRRRVAIPSGAALFVQERIRQQIPARYLGCTSQTASCPGPPSFFPNPKLCLVLSRAPG